MNEAQFIQTVNAKARLWGVNPLLLFSGLEGLHTFKDVPLNSINYDFLDSLILTIFALRIGDRFHSLAEENLTHGSAEVRHAAATELSEMNPMEIAASTNTYFQ